MKSILIVRFLSLVLTLFSVAAFGQTEKIIYNFEYPVPSGAQPKAGLIMDKAGNLYGTTSGGVKVELV